MTAPDFVEPIVGYRAWRIDAGVLVPWSAGAAGAWTPGVNTARCLFHPAHRAPVATCTCGLYALADPADDRLRPWIEAVGAIAAWGDVEVHRTGFRAEQAAVVALALPGHRAKAHEQDLRAAAERYGVALVPADRLAATACEFGRPIPWERLPARRPRDPGRSVPALATFGLAGIAVEDHVAVVITAEGVRLTPTAAAREAVHSREAALGGDAWRGRGDAVHGLSAGDRVQRGDVIARLGGEDGIVLRSPFSGHVAAHDGDAVVVAPAHWDAEAADVVWGHAAERAYAAELADLGRRGDAFAAARTRWVHATAGIRSAADVLEALRRERDRPRFATDDELYATLGTTLARRLATDEARRAARRLDRRILWRLHRPDAALLLDLTAAEPRVEIDVPDEPADLTLFAAAETADDLFAGRLDFAAAVRSRALQSAAPVAEVLRAASVLKPLVAPAKPPRGTLG